ncbi:MULTISPECIES: hypothetical protein [Pseudoalteromonas]|uniref:Uncharacterized protein n=1 Tax=Pseudoalteromonas luteoviolacea (strain 2ta16) TaxID=1353533 RepID=V4JI65_PSEL2|nr:MULTISPECIES: hypothetical protein [Pseudoalteromonas]ESP94607.1 hypothetical protein PL2TA16_00607 [Pseudoalteromonas luteoviolacea 2ta16]KZN32306.1 hypothetical protein N483_03915 [Pseudoalteromonas luteoviolacea NCIMB 1944]MCG7547557.1 hypothetical protein [Pseudoalteromonas sp. Of7M-16]
MKKGIIFAGVAAVAATLFWLGWSDNFADGETNTSSVANVVQQENKNTVNTNKLDELDKKLTTDIDLKIPKADPKVTTTEEQLLTAFQRMQLSVGKFNSASFINEEMQDLLHNPEMIEIAQKSLIDFKHAEAAFGEQQALVRVFSIRLLDQLAKAGEPGPLYEATGQLASNLSEQLANGEEIEKRRDLDLEDLVYASISTYDDEQVISSPEMVMMELGYFDDFHNDVRKIYANQFGSIISREKSVDETIEIVQKLFKKQS